MGHDVGRADERPHRALASSEHFATDIQLLIQWRSDVTLPPASSSPAAPHTPGKPPHHPTRARTTSINAPKPYDQRIRSVAQGEELGLGQVVSPLEITFCEESVDAFSNRHRCRTAGQRPDGYRHGQWGSASQAGAPSGSTSTHDNEIHRGAASNFGQELTDDNSASTDYANQAPASSTVGGSQTQYSSATNTPGYESSSPSGSGQSQTAGGSVTNFANSAASGSNVVSGFETQGVTGSQHTNDQINTGGSLT
ncbi:hypothetical protein [Streptomyces cyaneofuscatus]|uniref:hypothetical protein n=1 Tax=Streptomyces cyaneofuscatus TaxID=66883 RepID=UPI0033A9F6A0